MNRLFFLLLFFIPLVFSCNSKKDKKISKKTEFKNGRWISTTDSLAGIEIKNGKWIMFYKGTETSSIYDFKTRREYIKEIGAELEYLTITSDIHGDSLEYAILEYSNELLSLSYIGRGNTLNYIPEKEKEEEKEATEKDSKDKDVNNFPGTDSYYISTEGESKIYNYDSYQITTTDLYDAGFGELYGEQIKIFYKDGESIELTIGTGEYTGNNEEILFRGVIQNYMIIIEGGQSAPSDNGFRVFDLKNKKYVFEGAFYDEYKIVNSKIEFYNVIDHPYYPNYAESYGKFTKPKCSSELDALSKQYPGSIGYIEKLIYDIATQQLERTGIYKCAYFQ